MRKPRVPWDISLAAMASGFAVMGIELLASRLVAPVLGTSVLVWTNLIGVILLALAAGAWFGGYLADKYHDRRILGVLLFFAGILASFLPFAYQVATWLLSLFPEPLALPILALTLLAPTAFVLGAVPPAAVRLALQEVGEAGHVAGRLNAYGALGSLLGTYLTGYVLIAVWPVNWILAGITACLYIIGIVILRPIGKKNIFTSFFGLACLLAGQSAPVAAGEFIPSSYSAMRLSEQTIRGETVRVLWMDNARHGAAKSADTSRSTFVYYQLFMDFSDLMIPKAKTFLSIGGGTFHGPRLWLASKPDREATVIERDPAAVEASKRYFDLIEDPRLNIILGDGRASLSSLKREYDVVLIDAYADYMTIPWHLITEEAWRNLRASVSHDGFVVMNFVINSDQNLEANRKLISGTVNAAQKSFKYAKIVHIGNRYVDTNMVSTLLLLSNAGVPSDAEVRSILEKNGVLLEPAVYPLITEAFPAFTDQFAPVEHLTAQIVKR